MRFEDFMKPFKQTDRLFSDGLCVIGAANSVCRWLAVYQRFLAAFLPAEAKRMATNSTISSFFVQKKFFIFSSE